MAKLRVLVIGVPASSARRARGWLRRIAAELAIELDQARREKTASSKVTRLPLRGMPG